MLWRAVAHLVGSVPREYLHFDAVDLAGECPQLGGKGMQGRAGVNGRLSCSS